MTTTARTQPKPATQPGPPVAPRGWGPPPPNATGCDNCHYGVCDHAALRSDGPAPLYILRVYQAKAQRLEFCTCPAGKLYRVHLLKLVRQIDNGEEYVPAGMAQAVRQWLEGEKA